MELTYEPPIPPKPPADGFLQTIRLSDGGRVVGVARWHVRPGSTDGVAQLLDLTVPTTRARHGHGRQLMHAVYAQVQAYFRARRIVPRRLWIAVEQKTQIIGRSFLTGLGFHHVATVSNLMKDQDALVYTRSFD
jgi:ribosomal protein S18 acetylase RimI-like enzyme